MSRPSSTYELLSRVLTYPMGAYRESVHALPAAIPEHAEELLSFAAKLEELSLTELQELFTRTFDLNPPCSLEVGWHLYGEEYARGSFMVWMREGLREHGIAENGELPDHLTHVLLLLPELSDEDRAKFIDTAARPAVAKMLKALDGKNNSYEDFIQVIAAVLEECSPVNEAAAEEVLHG